MAKSRTKPSQAVQRLVGRWTAADEWATEVSLIISARSGKIRVRAVDQSDGEEAEVFDVKTTSQGLSFAVYWSSGQLTKYRLRALGVGQVEAVFTVTATATFKKATGKR